MGFGISLINLDGKKDTNLQDTNLHFPTHSVDHCGSIYGGKNSLHFIVRDEKDCINIKTKHSTDKIRIVSVHCGNPDFVALQKKSLDTFMLEPFEYIVYDDSIPVPDISNYYTNNMTEMMKESILKNGGEYRRIPPEIHVDRRCLFPHTIEPFTQNANVRVSNIFQFMFRDSVNFCSKAKIMFMEADILLTRPLNVSDLLLQSNASAVGVPQGRGIKTIGFSFSITYIWNPILIFDLPRLPGPLDLNFDCGRVYVQNSELSVDVFDYLDTSGHLYEWLHKHKPVIKFIAPGQLINEKEAPFVETVSIWRKKLDNSSLSVTRVEILGDLFIHFRNGGNWMSEGAEVKVSITTMVQILSDHISRVSQYLKVT
jgi:hypothetical protein